MQRYIKKRNNKLGLPPGSLIHIGDKKSDETHINIIDYNSKSYEEEEIKKVEKCFHYKEKASVTWINIDGIHNVDIIKKICDCFDIHPLVQEDIMNSDQRPKMEDYNDYIFFVLKMLQQPSDVIMAEQVSIILGKNFVLSFQETPGDVFDNIRDRIRTSKGRIRKMGADYLAYSLIDAIVDNYFSIIERMGDKIESIENKIVESSTPEQLQQIHGLKREMIFLRRSIWPLREVVNGLIRAESKLIRKNTGIYLRDVYDHTIHVIETVETFRDMVSGILDIYMSSVSNKMNEVMKVLTIFAAIFIPLTFVAGVYGMNFQYMPELNLKWGYFGALFMMFIIGICLIFYFKRKKWL